MKKIEIILAVIFTGVVLIALFAFQNKPQEKKLKFEFTLQQTELIYNALGKLPAEQVEAVRTYIFIEYTKQTADTTKKKSP